MIKKLYLTTVLTFMMILSFTLPLLASSSVGGLTVSDSIMLKPFKLVTMNTGTVPTYSVYSSTKPFDCYNSTMIQTTAGSTSTYEIRNLSDETLLSGPTDSTGAGGIVNMADGSTLSIYYCNAPIMDYYDPSSIIFDVTIPTVPTTSSICKFTIPTHDLIEVLTTYDFSTYSTFPVDEEATNENISINITGVIDYTEVTRDIRYITIDGTRWAEVFYNFSANIGTGENDIVFNVTYNGITNSCTRKYTVLVGVVDEDGDGLDDRTGYPINDDNGPNVDSVQELVIPL